MRAGLLLAMGLFIVTPKGHAACASPTADAGQMQYISGVYKFCNGTTWISMAVTNSGVACSSAGELRYQNSVMEYCNGSTWYKTAPTTNYGTCVVADTGRFYYGDAYFWFCNGANWRRMGP